MFLVDLEREKERLQNIMVHGKDAKTLRENEKKSEKKTQGNKMISLEERVEELILEIEDRVEFLNEMKALGKGKEYEPTIKQEIAAKLREMEKIDKIMAQKYKKQYQQPRKA